MIYTDKYGNKYEEVSPSVAMSSGERKTIIPIPWKPKSIWDLKDGEMVWVVGGGEVYNARWTDGYYNRFALDAGDIFLTEKEAQKELNKRQAIMRIKKYMWQNDIECGEFREGKDNFHIFYNMDEKKLTYICLSYGFHFNYLPEIYYRKDVINVLENCQDDLLIIFDKQ